MLRLLILCCLLPITIHAQDSAFVKSLADNYDLVKEQNLFGRTSKHSDVLDLIDKIRAKGEHKILPIGLSVEGRVINAIKIGRGKIKVLAWSQMHGNEPTATQSLFDLINWFDTENLDYQEKERIKRELSIFLIPMLNPDGAERYHRRNALGIDINRDAKGLISPESRILQDFRDSIQADFAFDLHDQNPYYGNPKTAKPATISFLAAYPDIERSKTPTRRKSVKLICELNNIAQQFIPGQVTRYEESFIPGAFDENFTRQGTSLVLIESGGYAKDLEKQYVRKINYLLLAGGLNSVATNSFVNQPVAPYYELPINEQIGFDLLIRSATFRTENSEYLIDIGIRRSEMLHSNYTQFFSKYYIAEKGDLSQCFGYDEIHANGLMLDEGKTYPRELPDINTLLTLDLDSLIYGGYTNFRLLEKISPDLSNQYPVNIVDDTIPARFPLALRSEPNFILSRNGEVISVVINGIFRNVR